MIQIITINRIKANSTVPKKVKYSQRDNLFGIDDTHTQKSTTKTKHCNLM
jgi:hypothetical protein